MKLSVYLDYTRKISKFPPWGRVEREGDCLQTFWTFSKKISNIIPKIKVILLGIFVDWAKKNFVTNSHGKNSDLNKLKL